MREIIKNLNNSDCCVDDAWLRFLIEIKKDKIAKSGIDIVPRTRFSASTTSFPIMKNYQK